MRHSAAFSAAAAIIALALVFCLLFCRHVHVLEIRDLRTNRELFHVGIVPGDRFSLESIHSVQLSRITDSYRIDQNYMIILVNSVFSDHGAGLPSSLSNGEHFAILPDGSFMVSGINRKLPKILLTVGSEYDNVFVFGQRRIKLSKLYGNALLSIRTKTRWSFVKP